MVNYKNKYLKYKLKFEKMINQKGGMKTSTQNIELIRIEQQLKENEEEAVKIKEEKTLLEAKEDYVEVVILLQKLIELKQIKENLEEQKKTLYLESSKLLVVPQLKSNTTQEFIGTDEQRKQEILDYFKSITPKLHQSYLIDRTLNDIQRLLDNDPTLQTLSLNDNNIGDPGVKHLVEMLQHNSTLQKLYLSNLSDKLYGQIKAMMNENNKNPASAKARVMNATISEIIQIVQHCQTTGEDFYKYLRINNLKYLIRFGNIDDDSYDALRAIHQQLPLISPYKYFNVVEPVILFLRKQYQSIIDRGKKLPPEYEGIIHQIFADDKQLSDIREIIERKLWDPNYKVV